MKKLILRALFLRPLRRSPIRFVATVLGVAVGVAAVIATVLASRAAVASLAEGVAEVAGASRLEVSRPGGVEASALAALRPLSDDALFVPVIEETARLRDRPGVLRVIGVDLLLDAAMRDVRVETGGSPGERPDLESTLVGRGALLAKRFADELGVKTGDPLVLLARSRETTVAVAAVFEPKRLPAIWDRIVFVDIALAQEIYDRGDRLDRIEVRPRAAGADLDALAARIAERLPKEYRVTRPDARAEETRRMVRALEFNLAALSGISVLVGIVLVATTLATSVVQRRFEIALLRSLGAGRGDVARAVLVEAGAIGALGGVLGVAMGLAGAGAALAGVRRTVATVISSAVAGDVRLDPALASFGFALGLLASLVAAILPLREAFRTPPLQGLRAERPGGERSKREMRPLARAATLALVLLAAWALTKVPAIGERPFAALGSALLLLSTLLLGARPLVTLLARVRVGADRASVTPLRIAQAALEAGRQRAAWASGAVGIAVALAVAMATMVGSFRTTVIDWAGQTMRSDLFLRSLPNESGVPVGRLDPAIVDAAVRLFGKDAVDPYHAASARFRGERISVGGAALDVVGRAGGGVPFRDGRDSGAVLSAAAARRTAIVDEVFARRYDVAEGDRVEFVTPSGPVTREVEGVFVDYGSHLGTIVLGLDDFMALYPDEGPITVAIFLGAKTDAAAARSRLFDALGGSFAFEALLNGEIRAEILNIFDRTFEVTTALTFVASAVAVIAVLTVLFALVRERKKDLGVLRTLGASGAQVRGVVVAEAGLLSAAGAGGGLVVGLAVGWVLVAVVNVQSFGWTLRFLPPWGAIAATALAVVPAGILAGLLPAIAAARTTPREVLHEDG